jgi:hypothetical protein
VELEVGRDVDCRVLSRRDDALINCPQIALDPRDVRDGMGRDLFDRG